jgi:asparagine synthase (glutamine-hydrolysing)
MRDTLAHRGPDDADLFLSEDKKVGFGYRSLRIAEKWTDGMRPFCNEDQTVCATCDGEIYNAPDLKYFLESKGHRFGSDCEAEVIVHLYEEMNEDFVTQLDGRFAIGLWDSNKQTLWLARDRLGEKPLYYTGDGRRFLFASELKAILEDLTVSRRIDPGAFHDYLTLQYIPSPNTILEGIKKLPPAQLLQFKKGDTRLLSYWRLTPEQDGRNRDDGYYEEKFLHLLHDAVRKRLAGNIRTGIHLNGGCSSAAIASVMRCSLNGNLKSFSFGLAGEGVSGFQYGNLISSTLGCDHQNVVLESLRAAEIVPRLARQFDEPLANVDAAAAYLISERIRREAKVCFSDEGSNEILGGCQRYEIALKSKGLADSLSLRNADIEDDLRDGLSPSLDRYLRSNSSFEECEMSRVLHPDMMNEVMKKRKNPLDHFKRYYDSCKNLNYLSRLQGLDISTYVPDNLNVKTDRMSMLASLQMRTPFLDHRLAEFTLSLPQNHRVTAGIDKYILRKTMDKHLSGGGAWHSKEKRFLPFRNLFKGDMEEYAKGLLLSPDCRHFRQGYLYGLLSEGWQESPKRALKAWTVIMFEQWRRIYNV